MPTSSLKPYKAGVQATITLTHVDVETLKTLSKPADVVGLVRGALSGPVGLLIASYVLAVKDECVRKDRGRGVVVTVRHWVKLTILGLVPQHTVEVVSR